ALLFLVPSHVIALRPVKRPISRSRSTRRPLETWKRSTRTGLVPVRLNEKRRPLPAGVTLAERNARRVRHAVEDPDDLTTVAGSTQLRPGLHQSVRFSAS